MTFQIAKSVIAGLPFDYAAAVEQFRQAKLAHRFTGDIAPSAPALIEAAVRRVPIEGQADDFVTDYEVIDDTPPAPTLDERKMALLNEIRTAEAAAFVKIISPGRQKLLFLDLAPIYAKPEADRTDAERELVASAVALDKRREAIQRHAAAQEIEVEDLTEATIDGWKPAAFPS